MFREDFVWGVASSAYQVEGTDAADGRGACVWDMFAADGRVFEHQNADTSCDHMHHYKEDIALMKHLGIRAYRFSLNWARILPEGTGRVNEKAIAMYRDMILTMKENGITPYLTLFHWEFPQALYERGGWQNPDVVQWFGEYAKVVAENFSDICEYFITINDPFLQNCICWFIIQVLRARHVISSTEQVVDYFFMITFIVTSVESTCKSEFFSETVLV